MLARFGRPGPFSDADAQQLRDAGVEVIKWDGGLSLEERVFANLPWAGVMASFHAARNIKGDDGPLLDQVKTQYGEGFDRNFETWTETPELRSALGKAAKVSEWFKRQSFGQDWAAAMSPHLDDPAIGGTDLIQKLNQLRRWIDNV